MRTFQSPHGRWSRYNSDKAAIAGRTAARDAARIAGPAPAYPPTAPLYGDWIGGRINGHTVIVRLMRDRGHRSDQWSAEIDGEVVADVAGLTMLWKILREHWPRSMSRREIAGLERGAG